MRTRRYPVALTAMAILAFMPLAVVSPSAAPAAGERLVEPAVLEKLLPAPEGWTRSDVRLNQIALAADCAYTAVTAWYTKGDVRVKLTLADSGSHPDVLIALAAMVVTLPEDYSDQVESAVIKRMKVDTAQIVEFWDAARNQGEIGVIVGGRFVASAESMKADSLDPIRAIFKHVDLKALGALK